LAKFTVVAGNSSRDLAKRIAQRINAEFIDTDLRVFPDGESKVTFREKPERNKIVVVQATYPPVDSNLIQALSIISKSREFSLDVIAVIPYLGYARQDKEFLSGEIVTIKVIADLFKAAGTRKLIVVDVHSGTALRHFGIPTKNVSAIPELVKYIKKLSLKKPLIVSPDLGGMKRAKEFAGILNSDFITLKKQRDRKTGQVKIITSDIDVVSRDIVLVDDMISTGSSIIKAAEFLKKQKCGKMVVCCTHALLIDNAEKKIKKAGVSKIVSTNTIPSKTGLVDVSNLISRELLHA
jgi:ribose-phosphate pyrophosphokinase